MTPLKKIEGFTPGPLTEEIKNNIAAEALKNWPVLPDLDMPDIIKDRYEPLRMAYEIGSYYGHNLASATALEQEKEIVDLREENRKALVYLETVSTKLGEADAMLERARSERDRILLLLEDFYKEAGCDTRTVSQNEAAWQQFRTINNL